MNAIRCAGLALLVVTLLCWAPSSTAYIALQKEPVAHRVAAASCVVLGKITAIQDKPVKGWGELGGGGWGDFTLVEVEVKESLFGAKDKKQIRFGFINRFKQEFKPAPAVGQVGYFCGLQAGENDFYIVPLGCFCEEKSPGFKADFAVVRRLGRLLQDPDKGLKSTDAGDRLLTGYLLVLRSCYVPWRRGVAGKPEPIDAEQSKRILLALAEGDWKKNRQEVRDAVAALQLSVKLGAPPLKGFPPEEGEEQWAAAAKEWLKQHADSYRIHRLTSDDKKGPSSK
ncbi:MAG TPA: hypothetical protein VKD72_12570 [Gemmataceae bacterium]|nr:hypothetical protein [Gemmataceae bacterium]